MTGLFNHPKRKLRKFIEDGEYEQAIQFANTIEEKFSKDPDFYEFLRTLETYEKVIDKKTTLVLPGDSKLFKALTQ